MVIGWCDGNVGRVSSECTKNLCGIQFSVVYINILQLSCPLELRRLDKGNEILCNGIP
jgi:hypothetical protein